MKLLRQTLDEIVANLSPLESSWRDETATITIDSLKAFPQKDVYTSSDVASLLEANFDIGLLISRLFMGLSKDELETELELALGKGIGIKRYREDRDEYLKTLIDLGILDSMAEAVNFKPVWSDILIERLRSTRGKAIRGQKRGRNLEDFVETIIQDVFGDQFETRCNFVGASGETAKCDFAVPNKKLPHILVEVKGYGATGSKMSDIIGDLNSIIRHKRHDTSLILFTDGVTWTRRLSDLEKIIKMQNKGEIARIYTTKMADAFRQDLQSMKAEYQL